MARTRATIMDIARELGLSKTTVSSALGGSGRISEEKRALIRETADRLGYVANRAARSLRVNRVGTIGLYIPPIARSLAFYMDFAFQHDSFGQERNVVISGKITILHA